MMEISALYILIFLGGNVNCFNFDTDFPIIFKDPKINGSYFGYALAMYNGNSGKTSPWIRIGAPKGGDTSKYKQPGTLYNCWINETCQEMSFPHNVLKDKKKQNIWDYGWIGGSMDVSYSSERHVVCGYKHYILHEYKFNDGSWKAHETFGTCFWSSLNSNKFSTIFPLLDFDYSVSKQKTYIFNNTFGEAGFSLHFPDKEKELILGAPGVYFWSGTILRVSDRSQPESNRRKRAKGEPFKRVEVGKPDRTKNFILFGYSVTSGYYYGTNQLYYAASAPKDNKYFGMVMIFTLNYKNDFIKDQLIKGEKFGEYFGSSLASGNVNNDNCDDLLVGAPFYARDTFNEGRVYLFLGELDSNPTILYGEETGGQFGTTIMFLGDINNDGFGDVAVGAPYENENSGNVYIYKGNKVGLQSTPVQKLVGKNIASDILGFGISISKAIDMDDNGYEDIAVGAYLSEDAILFRSKPLVTILYEITSKPEILTKNLTKFDLDVCFSYKMFKEDYVNLTYHIIIDEEMKRVKPQTFSNEIKVLKDETCRSLEINIQKHTNFDFKTPIKVSFSYGLNYPVSNKSATIISDKIYGYDGLCVKCPILDKDSSNKTFFETDIAFILNCGDDNKCDSKLNTYIKFPELSNNEVVIGRDTFVKLNILVENIGESAFSTKLHIFLPEMNYFSQFPANCLPEDSAIVCDIANPLEWGQSESVKLELDLTKLNKDFTSNHINVYTRVSTTSNNINNDVNTTALQLKREAEITIYGKTDQESNYYSNSYSISNSKLVHTYKVEKFGYSPLGKLKVKIQVPTMYTVQNKNYTFLEFYEVYGSFGTNNFSCNSDKPAQQVMDPEENRLRRKRDVNNSLEGNRNKNLREIKEKIEVIANRTLFLNCTSDGVSCFDVVCYFGPYDKEVVPATIRLKMIVNLLQISEIASSKNMVLISTIGEVTIESPKNFEQSKNRSHTILLSSLYINDFKEKLRVALWIIIVAVLIGLLLLVFLTLALIKWGFFKRTKKQELKNLIAAAEQEDRIKKNIEDSKEPEEEDGLDSPFTDENVTASTDNLCEK